MSKLLRANFVRLVKDKIFWLAVTFMFGVSVFFVCAQYYDMVGNDYTVSFDSGLLIYAVFIGFCSAVFSSMFTGTEYSDGTIRNKLIVGHVRTYVYLANLCVSVFAAIIMIAAYLVPYCSLGAFMLDAPVASAKDMLSLIGISVLTVTAYASIFNMLGMLITKKSVSAVVCLLLCIAMFMLAMIINSALEAPEFINDYILTADGIQMSDHIPNPKYLQPAARRVYQFFYDFIPTGQGIQLSMFSVVHPYLLMLYSACISVATTVIGVLTFRKKDLK